MRFKSFAAGVAAFSLAVSAPAQDVLVEPAFTADAFRAHVAFLADDRLEGRDAGSRGYDLAAIYVASRFEALGLKRGMGESWYQQVPFVEHKLGDTPASLAIGGTRFANGEGVSITSRPGTGGPAEAGAVFVGYGLDAPSVGFNDYRGIDARGKIVAVLSGVPAGLPSDVAAHLNSEKRRMADARGAIGIVTIRTPAEQARRPWGSVVGGGDASSLAWIGGDGAPFVYGGGAGLRATLDSAAAEALFKGSRRSLAAVMKEAARAGARPRGFTLKPRLAFTQQSSTRRLTSPNVLAILPGSDPKLAGEYVVLMAHLDHIGVDPDREGDKIHNGAMDNATGIATMLEVARAMAESPVKPRRSILFAAVTAEEDGLLGSQYLARNPVAGGEVVGVVNLDMPVLLYDFTDVIAFGAEHSTLGPIVERAAARMGVALIGDPLPQEGLFTRSDHYNFVREGVPSVFLMTGFAGEGRAQFTNFLRTHYHKPSDDLNLPIDWNAGAKFARINYLIAREIANGDARPLWYRDSFFGKTVAARQEKAAR